MTPRITLAVPCATAGSGLSVTLEMSTAKLISQTRMLVVPGNLRSRFANSGAQASETVSARNMVSYTMPESSLYICLLTLRRPKLNTWEVVQP